MSERDAAARMLAEEIAEESIFEPGSPRYLGKVARWQDKIAALLARREARVETERDRALAEGARLMELLSRASMGLSDAADEAPCEADRDHYAAGTREITEALTHYSPLSKLAGEVIAAALRARSARLARSSRINVPDDQQPSAEEFGQLTAEVRAAEMAEDLAADALQTALAREGSEG